MTIARRGLKVNIKVMGHANAVGPTSIEDSFCGSHCAVWHLQLHITLCMSMSQVSQYQRINHCGFY